MKKKFFYIAMVALALTGCADNLSTSDSSTDKSEVVIPDGAEEGELLIKFSPEMSDILDQAQSAMTRGGKAGTRSGIPSTDEVLDILGSYSFKRVFPVDAKTEARTREAGLHLWYTVKFDKNTDLKAAAERLSQLGEISKVQSNGHIKRAYSTDSKRIYLNENALKAKKGTRALADEPNDPGLAYQWHYNNLGAGNYQFENLNDNQAGAKAGCDVNAVEAWKTCTGDSSIIVAVLDEGVMYTHPDLAANMWNNPGETQGAKTDADGNGYEGDQHGYNFVSDSGDITWTDTNDSGHGTHVAGTIAAVNGNGIGVCGVAGGDGTPNSGVKIMSCQVFSGSSSVTLAGEARAIKYAADNGAVILQCSWGYNSSESSIIDGYTPGPATEKEWAATYPLEKEALDYFIHNAGSPNGVIDGGIPVFAAGNEYAGNPAFPGAYSKCVCVASLAADFTPACYTDFGDLVTLSAPGGDLEYYGKIGEDEEEYWAETSEQKGAVLSTLPQNGKPSYGFMEGTSMACPHVSGVAALGLAYAAKQHRHFRATDYVNLMKQSVKELDSYYANGAQKTYYLNHTTVGTSPQIMELSKYVGKMGAGLIDAVKLLKNIDGNGSDMKLPNLYVATGKQQTLNLAHYFNAGAAGTYTCTVANESVATATVKGTQLIVTGVANGSTTITVKASDGTEQKATVIVRKSANGNGWL